MTEPIDALPEVEALVKTTISPGTLSAPADAVPHEPVDTPWSFSRLNEFGHVALNAVPGTAVVEVDGVVLPIRSHARVFIGTDGPQVGVATVHPSGRVEGVVHDHRLGGRLLRHIGFQAITVTHDKVVIDDSELGE